ncbi:MAG: restriction endonuclease subunit R [Bacteroidetes bacterium 4484_249]|nr:MAG: restriction endonuclease subunit R [Bacteroidetes bacterium 4484_249]
MAIIKLNLPEYKFRIREIDHKKKIFDRFRKKFVSLTPEEWVRQNFLMYLTLEKNYPQSLIAIEAGLQLYKRKKRTDIVVYNNTGKPVLIVECKAPEVKLSQDVFDQIARYNMALQVNYLIVTNGLEHYCCLLDYKNNSYRFLKEIPEFQNIFYY